MRIFFSKMLAYLAPSKNLIHISLAAWIMHIILRLLLLFRTNPYGFPFVSKPDWYIFHAVCYDFIWIAEALLIFFALGALATATKKNFLQKAVVTLCGIFHAIILPVTLLDHELLRFLGCHLSFGLANTYKDTSSIVMFWDYVANDYSVPFLQFFVLALMLPATYGIYRLLRAKCSGGRAIKCSIISMIVFYIASSLFVNVIWTGNARKTKLRPVVTLAFNEIFDSKDSKTLNENELAKYAAFYQNLWQNIEGDSLWQFPDAKRPFYREPTEALVQNEHLQAQRAERPNFIIIFLESQRGMNVGFLNPQNQTSPTPYMDSIAAYSRIWERMHTSGLPTTGGVLTTHIGIPHHSKLAQATDLAHVSLPSFASVLTDSGYATHYFSAADPAWDNLGVWMAKWYTAQHYDRKREDDSTFFDHATAYVVDTLATQGKPFLATLMTRSNHYPFNFAAGMTDEQKAMPLNKRINITMNYADRQLARFMHEIEKQEWFKNTYIIIMADHGFPLGENGVSTMVGGGFSNATWIPFIVYGKGIEAARDTATAAQMDIAPTILELAGIAVPNIFMGHNLLRGYGKGLSLGAYSKVGAIGYENYRLISRYGESEWMFTEDDTHQKKDLAKELTKEKDHLKNLLDSLLILSDYTLEHGL